MLDKSKAEYKDAFFDMNSCPIKYTNVELKIENIELERYNGFSLDETDLFFLPIILEL